MKNDLLFLVAIPILLIAMPSNAFALLNQTNVNETNNLLKQILDQQKLQIQLQQSNANVTATKLARIMAQLHQLQQPANTNITNPVIGCGIGTDNSLCNLPVPPPPSPPLSPP